MLNTKSRRPRGGDTLFFSTLRTHLGARIIACTSSFAEQVFTVEIETGENLLARRDPNCDVFCSGDAVAWRQILPPDEEIWAFYEVRS